MFKAFASSVVALTFALLIVACNVAASDDDAIFGGLDAGLNDESQTEDQGLPGAYDLVNVRIKRVNIHGGGISGERMVLAAELRNASDYPVSVLQESPVSVHELAWGSLALHPKWWCDGSYVDGFAIFRWDSQGNETQATWRLDGQEKVDLPSGRHGNVLFAIVPAFCDDADNIVSYWAYASSETWVDVIPEWAVRAEDVDTPVPIPYPATDTWYNMQGERVLGPPKDVDQPVGQSAQETNSPSAPPPEPPPGREATSMHDAQAPADDGMEATPSANAPAAPLGLMLLVSLGILLVAARRRN